MFGINCLSHKQWISNYNSVNHFNVPFTSYNQNTNRVSIRKSSVTCATNVCNIMFHYKTLVLFLGAVVLKCRVNQPCRVEIQHGMAVSRELKTKKFDKATTAKPELSGFVEPSINLKVYVIDFSLSCYFQVFLPSHLIQRDPYTARLSRRQATWVGAKPLLKRMPG